MRKRWGKTADMGCRRNRDLRPSMSATIWRSARSMTGGLVSPRSYCLTSFLPFILSIRLNRNCSTSCHDHDPQPPLAKVVMLLGCCLNCRWTCRDCGGRRNRTYRARTQRMVLTPPSLGWCYHPTSDFTVMSHLRWREAIIQVLQGQSEPMHYVAIAEEIAERALRTDLRAAPAASVNSVIRASMRNEGDASPFRRAGRGRYSLRTTPAAPPQ
jgi:hypothetical protein